MEAAASDAYIPVSTGEEAFVTYSIEGILNLSVLAAGMEAPDKGNAQDSKLVRFIRDKGGMTGNRGRSVTTAEVNLKTRK